MINKKDFCSYIDKLVDIDKDIGNKSEKINDCTDSNLGTLIFSKSMNLPTIGWL